MITPVSLDPRRKHAGSRRRARPRSALGRLLVLATLAAGVAAGSTAAGAEPRSDFNRDVRPILSENCFACHGPDRGKRQADLRLDAREGILRLKEGRTVVAPGRPAESELYRRITSEDSQQRMPPPEAGAPLSRDQIAAIRKWIEEGAEWKGHWAYIPPLRAAPPALRTGAAARAASNEIDHFLFAKLEEHGLEPSPQADAVTLARRLHFDLTGLPPEPERVEAWAADPSPAAYEALVDELLASPHYGERMAVFWLDLVRYADSVGFHGDQYQSAFPFRDYVIRSFNDNKGFDRFTLEQIAGDLLPEATLEARVASGYNRLNMMSAEGGGQDKEYLAKYASDRVRNTSVAWLGATLGCAECHDHKFDPFTTRDFYSFAAFFADVSEKGIYLGAHETGIWGPTMTVPTKEQAASLERLDRELAQVRSELDRPTPELDAAQAEWEKSIAVVSWTVLAPATAVSAAGAALTVLEDGSILASGARPETDVYTVTAAAPLAGISAFRIEALPHDSLPQKGSGRAANGNFVLTEIEVRLGPAGAGESEQPVALQSASATFEQKTGGEKTPYGRWSAEGAIDGDAKGAAFGWAVMEEAGKPQHAVFETAADLGGGGGARLTFILRQNHGAGGHTLGRFRIAATAAGRPVRALNLPEKIQAALTTPRAARSDALQKEVAAHFRSIAPSLEPLRSRAAQLAKSREALETSFPRMLETVSVEPRAMRILPRGNWMRDDGEVVMPAVPAFLPQPRLAGKRATRADLASWLVAPDNPLTARVFVNRLWKLFFGAGISRRLDDLGSQGDWPSHPELLDWLALEFQESGWDVKRLVKLIVLSAAYRQPSLASREAVERDPYNRWLGRQARFRFDAEMVRDNALAVSGLLVPRIGGASARPYQPPGYWAYLNFPVREYKDDAGENQYRRGVYTHWQRQYLHPSFLIFDAPTREECTAERPRSNTPLQALVLLNDPSYVEAARVFAERIIGEGGAGDRDRIHWAFRRALSRPPSAAEAAVLKELHAKHASEYALDPAAAAEILKVGLRPVPAGIDPVDLAAWTSVARAILNLHESITRS